MAADCEWVPLGDADGVGRMWADWVPHLKAEGPVEPQ